MPPVDFLIILFFIFFKRKSIHMKALNAGIIETQVFQYLLHRKKKTLKFWQSSD